MVNGDIVLTEYYMCQKLFELVNKENERCK